MSNLFNNLSEALAGDKLPPIEMSISDFEAAMAAAILIRLEPKGSVALERNDLVPDIHYTRTDIQYRKSTDELKAAWFAYKETKPTSIMSLASFAAGFNAAIALTVRNT